jgi:hypothetical protein
VTERPETATLGPRLVERLYRSRDEPLGAVLVVGRRRVVPVATAVLIALAFPAVSVAGRGSAGMKCEASACKVYVESSLGPGGQQRGSMRQKPVALSKKTARKLARSGKDRKILTQLFMDPGYGAIRGFRPSAGAELAPPTALGAVLDLGSGPTVLLAVLIATAAGLAVHSGARSWRQRRARLPV